MMHDGVTMRISRYKKPQGLYVKGSYLIDRGVRLPIEQEELCAV